MTTTSSGDERFSGKARRQSTVNRYDEKLRELSKQPSTPELSQRMEVLARYRDIDLILDTAVALGMRDKRSEGTDMQAMLAEARMFLDVHNKHKVTQF